MLTNSVAVGLSLMLGADFRVTTEPLFTDGTVDVVEWSFDMGWGRELPPWLLEILDEYSQRNALLGHGVSYSVLDASETNRQAFWLEQLEVEIAQRQYVQLSEHLGFMGGGNFHLASPLPVPRTDASLRIGRDRLQRLAAVARMPVGLENLAFAFNADDVRQQGSFLDALLEPLDGFLLLDLHNLYCQSCNFGIDMVTLLDLYPLHRVRELHVSGGSWSEHPKDSGNQVRRDTHDGPVPEEIFEALPYALESCPNISAVILERLDGTIDIETDEALQGFRSEFMRLREIINEVQS